jgi:hypothetical protein
MGILSIVMKYMAMLVNTDFTRVVRLAMVTCFPMEQVLAATFFFQRLKINSR